MKFLGLVCAIMFFALAAAAQGPVKTVISDTLAGPDGLPANGQVTIINPLTFTSPDGYVIPAQSKTVAQITNGALTVSLVPNAIGTYYVANYSLSSGGFSEYWMVPSSSTPVTLASLRAQPPQLNVPNFMFAFYQLNPPANCLNDFPKWTSAGWTCSPGVGAVSSVFGRTGAVVAEPGDYSLSQITGTYASPLSLSGNGLSILPSGVTPGTYTNATVTVNAQGFVTALTQGTPSGANQQLSNLSGTVAINQSLNNVPLSRITMTGTALSLSDFALNGWGSSAASSSTVIGTDIGFTLTIVAAGTGQTLNPTVTLTFHDGPYTNAPVYVCGNSHGTSNRADVDYVPTISTLPMTWLSTPNASQTYVISCVGLGR